MFYPVVLDASAKPGPSVLRGNTKFMGNYLQCNAIKYEDPNSIRKDIEGHICRAYMIFKLGPVDFVRKGGVSSRWSRF